MLFPSDGSEPVVLPLTAEPVLEKRLGAYRGLFCVSLTLFKTDDGVALGSVRKARAFSVDDACAGASVKRFVGRHFFGWEGSWFYPSETVTSKGWDLRTPAEAQRKLRAFLKMLEMQEFYELPRVCLDVLAVVTPPGRYGHLGMNDRAIIALDINAARAIPRGDDMMPEACVKFLSAAG